MRGITRVAAPALLAAGLTIMAAGTAFAAVPTNDDFANATPIAQMPFTDAVNTVDATTQATDPAVCGGAAHSVWYSYTSDRDGTLTFDTFGSDFDTQLSAYTGTEGSLTMLACNDDSSNVLQSQVTIDIATGTTYYFMPTGCCRTADGTSGNLVVHADVSALPFTFDVTFSSGSTDPKTHATTVSGTVVCSESGSVDIAGALQQRGVNGSFSVTVACSQATSTFTATVAPSAGSFMPGNATVHDVVISGCGATDCDSRTLVGAVASIKLHP